MAQPVQSIASGGFVASASGVFASEILHVDWIILRGFVILCIIMVVLSAVLLFKGEIIMKRRKRRLRDRPG
jgi:hypothetical protein